LGKAVDGNLIRWRWHKTELTRFQASALNINAHFVMYVFWSPCVFLLFWFWLNFKKIQCGIKYHKSGWPDWANFRPLVDCLLWAVFKTERCSPKFLSYALFSQEKIMHTFILQKMVWATFWAIFHKLIWSPWYNWRSLIKQTRLDIWQCDVVFYIAHTGFSEVNCWQGCQIFLGTLYQNLKKCTK
jgi:hypothetical protein